MSEGKPAPKVSFSCFRPFKRSSQSRNDVGDLRHVQITPRHEIYRSVAPSLPRETCQRAGNEQSTPSFRFPSSKPRKGTHASGIDIILNQAVASLLSTAPKTMSAQSLTRRALRPSAPNCPTTHPEDVSRSGTSRNDISDHEGGGSECESGSEEHFASEDRWRVEGRSVLVLWCAEGSEEGAKEREEV